MKEFRFRKNNFETKFQFHLALTYIVEFGLDFSLGLSFNSRLRIAQIIEIWRSVR